MFVSEIMSKCVAECTEDMGLAEVYELIRKCAHGLVVVIDSHAHRVPIGVVSERSICEQVIARGRNPRTLLAGSVMVSAIRTVSETDLVESIRTHDMSSIVAIVVTDSKRQVCGLISPEKLSIKPSAAIGQQQTVFQRENNDRRPRAESEIPAFGWVQ